ncbi:Sodium/calcium exchanger protein-domain-containing protein [Earliella scabrosa]|nr:Sodium/calcium exchanger protein-domain-containing protein [Earliella scabrosa]
MLSRSSTREPLASFNHDSLSPSPSDDKCASHLQPLPLPAISRTSSRASSSSYTSTAALNPNHEPEKQRSSMAGGLFSGWKHSGEKMSDREAQHSAQPPGDQRGGTSPPLRAWHGWKLVVFDSWFNVLIFLLPVAGILKLTTEESEKLIFSACVLAMIPLVKLHDLATRNLSRRIGGARTGLLNSSLRSSFHILTSTQIIALRKCELRVVQSSLIGAMLSKLLLILGMCFFAGGLRFSEQGFDSTATQIHSSLLSISVGAVLLPAAYHFALTSSRAIGADDSGTTLQEQKRDILRMSHGVSIVLLFIYISYLIFQLWSHTHLYQDNTQPSTKLPVADSVITATARVRQKGSKVAERITHARSFEKLRSSSLVTLRTFAPKSTTTSRPTTPEKPFSPVEELPETLYDMDDASRAGSRTGPYMHSGRSASGSAVELNSRTALMSSPLGGASQQSLSSPATGPADSTVRLVSEQERLSMQRGGSVLTSITDSPSSVVDDSSESDKERPSPHTRHERGRSRTPISDVLSAYYQESIAGDAQDLSASQYTAQNTAKAKKEMSWTVVLLLLSVVTVLVALTAEWMVDSMDHLSTSISKEWIGLILLPTVSALAECITAINVSVQDQLTLSISVAVGSTIQTALFVIPIMVILGWILDKPLALLFDPFESVVLYISVHTMSYVVADGKSNWLEGVILVCLYIVIAVTFWFYPGSNFSTNLAVCTSSPPIALGL